MKRDRIAVGNNCNTKTPRRAHLASLGSRFLGMTFRDPIRGATRDQGARRHVSYFAILILRCMTTVLRLSKELRVLVSLLWPWYSARIW